MEREASSSRVSSAYWPSDFSGLRRASRAARPSEKCGVAAVAAVGVYADPDHAASAGGPANTAGQQDSSVGPRNGWGIGARSHPHDCGRYGLSREHEAPPALHVVHSSADAKEQVSREAIRRDGQRARVETFRVASRLCSRRQQRCGQIPVSETVQLVLRRNGDHTRQRMSYVGVETCGHLYCPSCGSRRRAREQLRLSQVMARTLPSDALFVTFTQRHSRGETLEVQQTLQKHALAHMLRRTATGKLGLRPDRSLVQRQFRRDWWWFSAEEVTYSFEHGFHPHTHALWVGTGQTAEQLEALLRPMWGVELLAAQEWMLLELRRIRREWAEAPGRPLAPGEKPWLAYRTHYGQTPPSLEERAQSAGKAQWEAARRVMGGRSLRRYWRATLRNPALEHEGDFVAMIDRAVADIKRLRNVLPDVDHGVVVKQLTVLDGLPRYLAPLGLELTNVAGAKLGSVDSRGIIHYSIWELATIAADPRSDRYDDAAEAFRLASRAAEQRHWCSWSGSVRDRYPWTFEQPEAEYDPRRLSEECCLGEIERRVWVELRRELGYDRLMQKVYQSLLTGRQLIPIRPPPGNSGCWRPIPVARAAPEDAELPAVRAHALHRQQVRGRAQGRAAWAELHPPTREVYDPALRALRPATRSEQRQEELEAARETIGRVLQSVRRTK